MINRDNYRAVKRYQTFLADVKQLDRLTLTKYRKELAYLLEWADETPFEKVTHITPPFPKWILRGDGNNDGRAITALYARRVCRTARSFLWWLRTSEDGFKEINDRWLSTFTMQRERSGKVAERVFFTVDEVRKIVALPADSLTVQRDQAAIAFLFLSGMRAGAFVTLTMQCVDVQGRKVKQWPDLGVMTKNRKAATTYMLDVPDLLTVVKKWDDLLHATLPDAALWYATVNSDGSTLTGGELGTPDRRVGLSKSLQRLCRAAGVPYKSIHKLRHGFTMHALEGADTIADLKAISQNLMHSSLTITDQVYGVLGADDQAARIGALGGSVTRGDKEDAALDALMEKLLSRMQGEKSGT